MKKCKICKKEFTPTNSTAQMVCSFQCAISYKDKLKKKKEAEKSREVRKSVRELKNKLKTTSDYLKETQTVFNKWIRLRDEGLNCISCNKPPKKKNAGHYRSVGSSPELRFEPLNVHLQCEYCNTYQHGNLIEYRKSLIKRIGVKEVEWLEGHHEPKHYSKPELIIMKEEYKELIRKLTK